MQVWMTHCSTEKGFILKPPGEGGLSKAGPEQLLMAALRRTTLAKRARRRRSPATNTKGAMTQM